MSLLIYLTCQRRNYHENSQKLNTAIVLASLLILILALKSMQIHAAEPQYSIYTIKDNIKRFYPNARILKDNRGYYFTYRNNGYFECYLGKSKYMTLPNFSKKLGGGSSTSTTTQTITAAERKLKQLSAGLLAAYFTKDVHWLCGWVSGVSVDSAAGKILRTPGKYRYTTKICTIKIRNGALKKSGYEKSFYITTQTKVEKYNTTKRRYATLYNNTKPQYNLMVN